MIGFDKTVNLLTESVIYHAFQTQAQIITLEEKEAKHNKLVALL